MKFSYTILKYINNDLNLIVFEEGVVSREKIDSHHYLGQHGWSFNIYNCNTSICLGAIYDITNTNVEVKVISSSSTAGSVTTRRLGFFVNMNRKKFSVIDNDTPKILTTFTTVVSADQLCLAFGVNNPLFLFTRI